MKLLLVALVVASATSQLHAETLTKTFPAKGVTSLEIQNAEGAVNVTTTDEPQAGVVARKIAFGKSCALTVEQVKSRLVIAVKDGFFMSRERCQVDWDVKVPRNVDMEIKNGSGPVVVKGVAKRVVYQTGSGDVTMEGEFASLDGKTGSGAVNVRGLEGSAELKTGSGDITVAYLNKPTSGTLDVTTGSGNTTVSLPADTKVRTSFKVGSGSVTNELGDSPQAPFAIVGRAGSGNLVVKKAL